MTPRLHAAVDSYEKAVAPIAARKLTRVAALHAVSAAFWRDLWPVLRREKVLIGRIWGWKVQIGAWRLESLFRSIFGAPSFPHAHAPTPAALAARPAQRPVGAGGLHDHPLG